MEDTRAFTRPTESTTRRSLEGDLRSLTSTQSADPLRACAVRSTAADDRARRPRLLRPEHDLPLPPGRTDHPASEGFGQPRSQLERDRYDGGSTVTGRRRADGGMPGDGRGAAVARLHVNGTSYEVATHPSAALLWAFRDEVGCSSVKYGCGGEQCGACRVLIDGAPACSCTVTIAEAAGRDIAALESLGTTGAANLVVDRDGVDGPRVSAAIAFPGSCSHLRRSDHGEPVAESRRCRACPRPASVPLRLAWAHPGGGRRGVGGTRWLTGRGSGALRPTPTSTSGWRCVTAASWCARARPSWVGDPDRSCRRRSRRARRRSGARRRRGPGDGVVAERADHRGQRLDRAESDGGPPSVRAPRRALFARAAEELGVHVDELSCERGVGSSSRRPPPLLLGPRGGRRASGSRSTTWRRPCHPPPAGTRGPGHVRIDLPDKLRGEPVFVHDAPRCTSRPRRAPRMDRPPARPAGRC